MVCEQCGDEDCVRHRALIKHPDGRPPEWGYVCDPCFQDLTENGQVVASRPLHPNLVPPRLPRRGYAG